MGNAFSLDAVVDGKLDQQGPDGSHDGQYHSEKQGSVEFAFVGRGKMKYPAEKGEVEDLFFCTGGVAHAVKIKGLGCLGVQEVQNVTGFSKRL